MRTDASGKILADLIMMENQLVGVSAPLKRIIEQLEPDQHQFWPMDVTGPRNETYATPYYGMICRNFRDSFDPANSDPTCFSMNDGAATSLAPTAKVFAKLSFSTEQQDKAHIWRETSLYTLWLLISDDLHDAVKQAGLDIGPCTKNRDS